MKESKEERKRWERERDNERERNRIAVKKRERGKERICLNLPQYQNDTRIELQNNPMNTSSINDRNRGNNNCKYDNSRIYVYFISPCLVLSCLDRLNNISFS